MKNIFLKIYIILAITLISSGVAFATPISSQGTVPTAGCNDTASGMEDATKYCLTAPIPIFGTEVNIKSEGLGTYINKAISVIISIGALMAVIMIVKYGFQYMLKDTPMAIGSAKSGMKDAFIGLLLIMSTYLILKTINPKLVEFSLSINETAIITDRGANGNIPIKASSSNPADGQPDFVNGNNIIGSCPVYRPKSQMNPNGCDRYDNYIKKYTNDPNMRKLLKAKAIEESSCGKREESSAGACGPFQFLPGTAQDFAKQCGVDKNVITCDWLKNDTNEDKATCLAEKYFEMTQKVCGNKVQNWIAAYNAGTNACKKSISCGSMVSCLNSDYPRQWECIYDNTSHTLYNTGYNETREAVKKVMDLIGKVNIE